MVLLEVQERKDLLEKRETAVQPDTPERLAFLVRISLESPESPVAMAQPELTDCLERGEKMVFLVETELMDLLDPEVCLESQVFQDETAAADERVRSDLLETLASRAETVMTDHVDAMERRANAV